MDQGPFSSRLVMLSSSEEPTRMEVVAPPLFVGSPLEIGISFEISRIHWKERDDASRLELAIRWTVQKNEADEVIAEELPLWPQLESEDVEVDSRIVVDWRRSGCHG